MNFEKKQTTEKERLYIAYGSNLNLMQMSMRCPTALIHKTAELVDHELVFRGSQTGFYATVEPCEGKSVPVLLWKIQPADEERLDIYEGYPRFYDKENALVTTADGEEIYAVFGLHVVARPCSWNANKTLC
ncbi:MAG: gamma-glutamylcyclotransferase family protein [Bacillota bacterium]